MTDSSIYLKPGDVHFGPAPGRLATLLGSCVAITLWHPRRALGGMCHVVFPDGPAESEKAKDCDNRYARCAFQFMADCVAAFGTRAADYRVGLFGGGDMFADLTRDGFPAIGELNVQRARELLAHHGFSVGHEHVGGRTYRRLNLDLGNGRVELAATRVQQSAKAG